jgi:hypothetical protein
MRTLSALFLVSFYFLSAHAAPASIRIEPQKFSVPVSAGFTDTEIDRITDARGKFEIQSKSILEGSQLSKSCFVKKHGLGHLQDPITISYRPYFVSKNQLVQVSADGRSVSLTDFDKDVQKYGDMMIGLLAKEHSEAQTKCSTSAVAYVYVTGILRNGQVFHSAISVGLDVKQELSYSADITAMPMNASPMKRETRGVLESDSVNVIPYLFPVMTMRSYETSMESSVKLSWQSYVTHNSPLTEEEWKKTWDALNPNDLKANCSTATVLACPL